MSNHWVNSCKHKLCALNKLPIKVCFNHMHFGGQIYIEFASSQKMEAYRFPSLVPNLTPIRPLKSRHSNFKKDSKYSTRTDISMGMAWEWGSYHSRFFTFWRDSDIWSRINRRCYLCIRPLEYAHLGFFGSPVPRMKSSCPSHDVYLYLTWDLYISERPDKDSNLVHCNAFPTPRCQNIGCLGCRVHNACYMDGLRNPCYYWLLSTSNDK